MKQTIARRVWVVAAGTGGHIFPGLTLGEEIKRQAPESSLLFFGTRDRLEAKIIPQHGQAIKFLSAKQWKGRGPMARIRAVISLSIGFWQVVWQLMRGRPSCLISVGGYVSVPTALACLAFGVPLFIVEPNVRAGLANRILSRWARQAYCAPGSDAYTAFKCKTLELGSPIRSQIVPVTVRAAVRKVLVLGGSQGSLALCKAVLSGMALQPPEDRKLSVTLQTGAANLHESLALKELLQLGARAQVVPFIDDVAAALADHDVVIARAGAMTLAELAVAGLPTILVPYPHAADDHQRINAAILARAGAAWVVSETEGNFEALLVKSLHELCGENSWAVRQQLAENFRKWGRPAAAHDIARQVLSLTEPKV